MTDARQPSSPSSLQVVAHRGASDDAPEHTLAAYRKAVEDGADALECDVRLTADGHLVCVHDRRVNRTSNGRGAVSALELSQLAALDFGSWKDREESPDWDPVPGDLTSVLTLERLLELVTEVRATVAAPARHRDQAPDPVGGTGRGPAAAPPQGVRPRRPTRRRSLGRPCHELLRPLPAPGPYSGPHPAHRLPDAVPHPRLRDGRLPAGARIAGPGMRIVRNHPDYVRRLHGAGHRVHVWTVNEPEDVALCAELGIEAIITNRPKKVLAQLGRG